MSVDIRPPLVSVLLPVRNGQKWIVESLTSIARQTYRDFEVVLVDDGSTDDSVSLALGVREIPYLRVMRGSSTGLANALAAGVLASRGKYVARHDVDDLSLPDRLQLQVDFLEQHADFVACGTSAICLDDDGKEFGYIHVPSTDRQVRAHLLFGNPLVHSSVLMRRETLIAAGNYRSPSSNVYPEDFDLWSRLQEHGRIGNLKIPLVLYRKNEDGVTASYAEELGVAASAIAAANLERELSRELTSWERHVVATFNWRTDRLTFRQVVWLYVLLCRISASYRIFWWGRWGSWLWVAPVKGLLSPRR